MKWNVKFLLRNFRKETKSKNEKRIAIIVRKRDEKTKERHDIQRNRRNKQSIIRFWNRKSHEIKRRIFLFSFDEKTKKHKHRHKQRNIETINNDRHSINKIISFDKWYRWIHRRIKRTRTTNFNTSQRNFHEIVKTLKNFIFWKKFSLSRQKKQRQQRQKRFWSFFNRLNENFWKQREKSRKNFDFHRNFKKNSRTFSFFIIHDEQKKKK